MHRPWFTRLWVYQEFALAQNAPMWHCGQLSTSNINISRDISGIMTSYIDFGCFEGNQEQVFLFDPGYKDIGDTYTRMSGIRSLISMSGRITCLQRSHPAVEYWRASRTSTNPRDIVYGL